MPSASFLLTAVARPPTENSSQSNQIASTTTTVVRVSVGRTTSISRQIGSSGMLIQLTFLF